MAIPILVWMAAGVGAVGVKLYKDATSPTNIVLGTIGRYEEEKYKFIEVEDKVLTIIEHLASEKLEAWGTYKRMFTVLRKIENRPIKYSFKKHDDMRLMPMDIERLMEIGNLVEEIKEKKLNKIGTGLFTVVALHGGAATLKSEDEKENEDKKKSILENFVSSAHDFSGLGKMEEYAVLNNLLRLPQLVEDKDLDKAKTDALDKNSAFAFKEDLDRKSLLLADAKDRLKRLLEILEYVDGKITKLHSLYLEQIEYLEQLVQKKNNYNDFDDDEQGHLSYAIAVGSLLREIARTDVITANEDIAVINRIELHKVIDKGIDLIPIEQPKLNR